MNQCYHELLAALGTPQWFDEHAVPRYIPFAPREVANIYADQVLLVEIRCQGCRTRFKVAFSESLAFLLAERITAAEEIDALPRLFDAVAHGGPHYGDPPNVACCPSGPTMNSEPIRVLEAWERPDPFEWVRRPELEIDLDEPTAGEGF